MSSDLKQDSIAILLVNRTYLYRLLQNFFGNEPTLNVLNILYSDHTRTALELLSIEDGLHGIKDFIKQLETNKDDTLEKCCSEYTRLFIGPTTLPAPPWESVYLTKERLIFQESTLKVRQCYLKYNFLPVNYRSEADDHLALELDFMANLSQLTESVFQDGKINEGVQILMDQKAFLEQHLLVWVPQFVSELEAATSHPLYREMASILREFLQADLNVIDQILDSI